MLVLSACNPIKNIQKRERISQLRMVANTYRKLMRWGHYDQAAQYLKARDGVEQTPDFKDMQRYKVTNYSVGEQIISDTEFEAKVTAYVDFYDIDSGRASAIQDEQYWWYDDEENRWYLGSPMIDFSAAADVD